MKTLTKFCAAALCIAALLSLSACGSAQPQETPELTDISYSAKLLSLPKGVESPCALAFQGTTLYTAADADGTPELFSMDTSGGEWSAMELDLGTGTVSALAAGAGKLYAIVTREDRSKELAICDPNAQTANTVPLEELADEDIDCMLSVGDKLIVQTMFGAVHIYGDTGEYICGVETEGFVYSISAVNGSPYACVKFDKDDMPTLCSVDVSSGALTPLFKVDCRTYYSFTSESGMLLADESSVWSMDADTGERTKLFDWLDCGISLYNDPLGLSVSGSGDIFLADGISGMIFRLSPRQDTAERKELTIACGAGSYGTYLTKAAALFNLTNEEYIAKLQVYSHEEAERVTAEISAGNPPDIVYLGSSTDRENVFADIVLKSTLFEDLLPYLDSDPELSREDFLPSVLDSMTENGHLYGVVPGFMLHTVIGPKALADSLSDWTVDTLFELNDSQPDDHALFGIYSRDMLLEEFSFFADTMYVDRQNQSCSFDDGGFARLLELCTEVKYYDYSGSYGYSLYIGTAHASSFRLCREAFGGEYAYMGYPGGESFFSGLGAFSIMASSENKDAAWQFIRLLLMPQIQENEITLFCNPVMESSFDAVLEGYIENENMDFTRQDAEWLKNIVLNTDKMAQGGAVKDIIFEEAEKFFAGDKTADEAAASIQSRASIYISEQYG